MLSLASVLPVTRVPSLTRRQYCDRRSFSLPRVAPCVSPGRLRYTSDNSSEKRVSSTAAAVSRMPSLERTPGVHERSRTASGQRIQQRKAAESRRHL